MSRVVRGRFTNSYSLNDHILLFYYFVELQKDGIGRKRQLEDSTFNLNSKAGDE
jgi:hypothetical protein